MEYIALLRGINVGKSIKISMKELKEYFELLGCTNVSTYINSGNVLFESIETQDSLKNKIEEILLTNKEQEIRVLIKTKKEVINIAKVIPAEWTNDTDQKTDVAYLFDVIDHKEIIYELPIKKEYVNLLYVKGAIIWNVSRNNYNKSHFNKIISHKVYKEITVRNVNTARYLAFH